MAEPPVQRRLAAILAADVAGYSRLMGVDEEGTLARLTAHRNELVDAKIGQHRGRIVKTTGDGLLVEFASVVDAVRCAVELQRGMLGRNADVPPDSQIHYRVGITVGDIIIQDGDIFGDGVNIAARLEGLAEPGGICISSDAYRQVHGKLDVVFEDVGEQRLKNIAAPVRVYRVRLGGAPATARPALALPDKPSIAVLPFDNMSSDADQEFFATGISEDLITGLSRFHSLFVISRNSAFSFKDLSLSLKDISGRLGVRYIVEGSVRRAGNRLRITAQLIDALDDKHLWAERYDRQMEDIFDVQDEVVRAIISAIEPRLLLSERNRALRKPPESLDAWENYQRGLWHVFRYRPEERQQTLFFFGGAIALDPRFASAYAGLAYALYVFIILGASPDRAGDLDRALKAARLAVSLDEHDPFAHVALSRAHLLQANHEAATLASDRAIQLNPSYALAHFGRGHSLWHQGRPAEAIAPIDEAIRLSPHDPMMWAYMASKAIALALKGELDEAVLWSRRAQQQSNAAIFAHVGEVCALGLMEHRAEAADAVAHAKKTMPDVTVQHLNTVLPITHAASRETFLKGLKQAGLPE